MNRKILKRIIFTTFLIVSAALLSSCSADYRIKGRVIFLPELNSVDGFIAEVTEQTIPSGGTPIVSAKIRMITQLDEHDKPVEKTVWQNEVITDETGLFELTDSGKPTKELKVGIEISKSGFKTIYETRVIQSGAEPKVFLIFMVPTISN
jgi:hypothetical protein